jgi:hypothetical protein
MLIRIVVGLLAYFTFLSTLTSIIQQLHTMIWWDDVKTEQWKHAVSNIGSVEVTIAGPSVGLDLALFYIRMWSNFIHCLVIKLTRSKNITRTMLKDCSPFSGLLLWLSPSLASQT